MGFLGSCFLMDVWKYSTGNWFKIVRTGFNKFMKYGYRKPISCGRCLKYQSWTRHKSVFSMCGSSVWYINRMFCGDCLLGYTRRSISFLVVWIFLVHPGRLSCTYMTPWFYLVLVTSLCHCTRRRQSNIDQVQTRSAKATPTHPIYCKEACLTPEGACAGGLLDWGSS